MFEIIATRHVLGPTKHFYNAAIACVVRITPIPNADVTTLRQRILACANRLPLPLDVPEPETVADTAINRFGCLFAWLAMAIQRATDAQVSNSAVTLGDTETEHDVTVWLEKEDFGTAAYAGELAATLLNSLTSESLPDESELTRQLGEYYDYAIPRMLDPNTRLLIAEARKRHLHVADIDQFPFIPTRANSTIKHGLIQIGMGCRQRRFLGPKPDSINTLALQHVYRLDRLMPILKKAGIPTPKQDLEFMNKNKSSRLLRAAQRIGLPVILKPAHTPEFLYALPDHPVLGPLSTQEEVVSAYEHAFDRRLPVWIESYVPGDTYRFLVIDQQIISVLRQHPPQVVGDGRSNLRELVQEKIRQSQSLLERQAWSGIAAPATDVSFQLSLLGLTWESIAKPGQVVQLRRTCTPYNGGTCDDVSSTLPQAFQELALTVALACQISIAGIEIVISNPDNSPSYPNCAVTSVIPDPDLYLHSLVKAGADRTPATYLLRSVFPDDSAARIPIASITGTNGKTTTSRMLAHTFRTAGYKVGLTCSNGVYINGERLVEGDMSGSPGSYILFFDNTIEVAILETARGGLIKAGRPFDNCDVGVCLNVENDHIGFDGIFTLDQMAGVKRQVIENTTGTAILNADDPYCMAMIPYFFGDQVVLFSGDVDSLQIAKHLESQGKAVFIQDYEGTPYVTLSDGTQLQRVLAVEAMPATHGGHAQYNVDNALAAIAGAYALGMPMGQIAYGMSTFFSSFEDNPGRFNEYFGQPFRCIMDVVHNPHGLRALSRQLDLEPCRGRRIAVYSLAVTNTDSLISDMTQLMAKIFDYFICTMRNNEGEESVVRLPGILRETLLKNGVPEDRIQIVLAPEDAVDAALKLARPGDLVLVMLSPTSDMVFKIGPMLRQLTSASQENQPASPEKKTRATTQSAAQ